MSDKKSNEDEKPEIKNISILKQSLILVFVAFVLWVGWIFVQVNYVGKVSTHSAVDIEKAREKAKAISF